MTPALKNRLPERVQLSEPVLICYRMLRRCQTEGASVLRFFENRIERQTTKGEKTGVLRTPKPFAAYMRHILENDPAAAGAVESVKVDGLNGLTLTLKSISNDPPA